MPAKTEKQRSLEYWAGFFDGEGSVWISLYQKKDCSRPQASLKVGVSNTYYAIIADLAHDFPPPSGRVINSFLGGAKDKVKRRQQYKWEMSGWNAYIFLKMVEPYLVVKREQAQTAIEFYEKPWRSQRRSPGGGWKIRTDGNVAMDIEYSQMIKEMKYACKD